MKDLPEILETKSQGFPKSSACVWINDSNSIDDEVTRLTYASAKLALQDHKASIRQYLLETKAVVVAYLSGNDIDFFLSVLACSDPTTLVTPALLNTRWTVTEIVAAVESADPNETTLLLYSLEMERLARQVPLRMNHKVICKPIPQHSVSRLEKSPMLLPQAEATTWSLKRSAPLLSHKGLCQYDAVIVFSSGTTSGRSKGVRLSHRAVLVQAHAKSQDPCGYDQDTRLLATTVPFYHVGGLSSILAVWMAGGTLVFPRRRRKESASFDPAQVLESLSAPAHIATNTLVVVPAMIHSLQAYIEENQSTATFPHVRLLLVGGQSASTRNLDFVSRVFPNAKTVQTYACTEAASSLTFLDVKDKSLNELPRDMMGDCVGYPTNHVQLSIVAEGQPIPASTPFHIGNIAFRGPCRMSGYWQRGKVQRKTDHLEGSDQWFVTNDLGFWDSRGRLYFVGRSTDSIRTGAETVYAAEVERIIIQHPCVEECAVFPLKDDKFGETVCCAVVCKSRCPSLSELREFCAKQGLADYKRPTRLFTLRELPKNSSGKVLKFRLVELYRHDPALRSKL